MEESVHAHVCEEKASLQVNLQASLPSKSYNNKSINGLKWKSQRTLHDQPYNGNNTPESEDQKEICQL